MYTEKSLWDNFKITNIHITEVLEGEDSKNLETYLKKMTENFSNLVKKLDI